MKRVAPLCALLVLAFVSNAHAAVTASQITNPPDPYQRFFDLSAGQGPYGIQVAGTATINTAGSRVDIRCYATDGVGPVLATFNVDNTTHTFSGYIEPGLFVRPCLLRAVNNASTPADPTPFKGVRVYPSVLSDARVRALDSPNAGVLYDVFDRIIAPDRTGTLALGSLGGCGLYFARPMDPGGDPSGAGLDVFNCAGWVDLTADGTPESRSDIQVDGHNAFTGGQLQNSNTMPNVSGMPQLAATRTYDATSGTVKLEESSAVVRCPNELDPFPAPDAATATAKCGTLTDAGVRYARTTQTSDNNRVVTVLDRWASTDGAAHTLDLLLEMDMASTTYGWQLPWVGPDFASYSGTTSIPGPPSAPGSILVRSDVTRADAVNAPVGAITYTSAPNSIEFYDDGKDISQYPQLHYVRTVPASGELRLQHTYAIGTSLETVRTIATRVEDGLVSPQVTIATPAANSTVKKAQVVATGTATDNGEIRSLTVNGTPVAIGAGGAWSATITLAPGANTITVAALDAQGNRAEAQVAVTYAVPAPPCVVPSIVGLGPVAAKRKLVKKGCTLGAVSRHYYKPRRVKKGRKRITVRYRTGHIVVQRVKPGAKVDNGTAVRVTVQGSKPKLKKKTKKT